LSAKFRRLLLVAWVIFVAALVLAAALLSRRWNVIAGVAIIGLVLFFRVSKRIYPGRPAPPGDDQPAEGRSKAPRNEPRGS